MTKALLASLVLSIGLGCGGSGGGTGGGAGGGAAGGSGGGAAGGSGGGAGGGSAGGAGGGSAGGAGGGSAGGTGGGTAGGAGGGATGLLSGIDANGGNYMLVPGQCASTILHLAALPNGGFVATCTGTGYLVLVWTSTAADPMVFTKAAQIDRSTIGVAPGNVNHAAYGVLTLADNSILFLAGDAMGGVKSLKLPAGGSAFEAPVTVAATISSADRCYFGTPQSPGAGVFAFSDGANVKVASTTDGNTWTLTPNLAVGTSVALSAPSLRVDTAGAAYVVAGTSTSSTNVFGKASGGVWSNTMAIASGGATWVAVSADGQKVALYANSSGKVWVSTNGGVTFPAAATPTVTSPQLVTPLSLGAWLFSDGSHGAVGVANGATSWCSSPTLAAWTCGVGPGDSHLAGVGFAGAATITPSGTIWAAAPKGIGKLK